MKYLLLIVACLTALGCGNSAVNPSGRVTIAGRQISEAQKQAVEAGLSSVFQKARCRGYSKKLSLMEYTVRFEPGGVDAAGNPALKIPCGSYCGTEWDKGGYILIAGQVKNGEIVLPVHNDEQRDNLSRITEYEAEHIILEANDKREYERTKVHGAGTGHPLLAECR